MRLKNSNLPHIPSSQPFPPLRPYLRKSAYGKREKTGVLGVQGIRIWGHLNQWYWTRVEWNDGAPVPILRIDVDTKRHRRAGLAHGRTTAPRLYIDGLVLRSALFFLLCLLGLMSRGSVLFDRLHTVIKKKSSNRTTAGHMWPCCDRIRKVGLLLF